MAEPYFKGGPRPQSLDETLDDFKKIGKGLLVGETADILGLPADLLGLYYDVRYGETPKGIQSLIDQYGSEALAKKFMGQDFPEFGFDNLESAGRAMAPGALLAKGIMTARLMARGIKPPPPPSDDLALQSATDVPANNTYIMDVPKTTGEKLAMSANEGIGGGLPPKKQVSKGPKNFEEAGEKHIPKSKLPEISAFRGGDPDKAIKSFMREQEDKLGINATQQFFSPTAYFFENSANLIGFGKKPKKGIEILNSIITNNKVPRSVKREMRSLGLDNFLLRNSETAFTREDFIGLLNSVKPQITVETFSKIEDAQKNFPSVYTRYESMQRSIQAKNKQLDYGWMVFADKNSNAFGTNTDADLVVKNSKTSTGSEGHDYAGKPDESPGYFGHIRYSIQEIDGERVLVPEEIQADAVRATETTDKVITDTLPVRGTPTRRVSEADRKNLQRADSYLSSELKNTPLGEQSNLLNSVDLTDRSIRFTNFGGPEEVLLIKQAQDGLPDNVRREVKNYALDKKNAVTNRRTANDLLQKTEIDYDTHLKDKDQISKAFDLLDSALVGVESQKKFIRKINAKKGTEPSLLEETIAPPKAVFSTRKGQLKSVAEEGLDKVFNRNAKANTKFMRELTRGLPGFEKGIPLDLESVNMGGHHLNIFDIGYSKEKLSGANLISKAFADHRGNMFTPSPSFLSSIRLLDPDRTIPEKFGIDLKNYQLKAIDQDPDKYVSSMKTIINKELINKTQVEETSAEFINTLLKDPKFMKEIERSKNRLETMQQTPDFTNEMREEMSNILKDAVEFSFSDDFLNKLAYKLVDESFNRTNFFPSYRRTNGGIFNDIYSISKTSDEIRETLHKNLTPFVQKNILSKIQDQRDKVYVSNQWQERKSVDSSGMASFFKIIARDYARIDDMENLLENEFITNKKLQRDIAALDLKETVFGFSKDTISGQKDFDQNGFYLGMRGTTQTEQKGGLHSALGRLNFKDFDNKAKGLKKIKEDAFDKAMEADRVVTEKYNPTKTKESYQRLADALPDNKSKELVKKAIEKIIDYDLDVPNTKLKKQPPFKSMEDFSKFAIRSAVREAHKRGIKKIIVPTAENYAGEAKSVAIGTYNKAPREAMEEYVKHGGKLSTRKLPEIGYDVKESNVLDISEIDDAFFTETSASLFSKGGIVRKAS